jgi:hypothetical protein
VAQFALDEVSDPDGQGLVFQTAALLHGPIEVGLDILPGLKAGDSQSEQA